MLILTWTLTSTIALIGAWIIGKIYEWNTSNKWSISRGGIILIIIVILLGCEFIPLYGEKFINQIMIVKGHSINQHLESLTLDGLSIMTFFGIAPQAHHAESSIVNLLFTNGIVFEMLFYGLGMYSVVIFRRVIINISGSMKKNKPILIGMMYYQLAFIIGSINLPFTYMFFNMLVFSIFAGISFTLKKNGVSKLSYR